MGRVQGQGHWKMMGFQARARLEFGEVEDDGFMCKMQEVGADIGVWVNGYGLKFG